jgi:flagellar hook assembly protein FlgD
LYQESFVKVAIYNILGEKIVVLSEGIKSSGYHNIFWNGTNQFGRPVSSGIYFVSVHFGQQIYHQKIMLLK